jgi:hypothetical protein
MHKRLLNINPTYESVYDYMSYRLGARHNFQHEDDLIAGVDNEPSPQGVSLLVGLGAELIQLDVQELQTLE